MKAVLISLGMVAVGATAATAGGYTPVVVEAAPVAVVAPAPAPGNWQGAYVGGTLGYGFGGDDRVGYFVNGTQINDNLGNAKIHGLNAGLRVGYRWQRDRFVFGPELSVEGGNVSDSFTNATYGEVKSKLKNQVALKLKAGAEVQPNMLVFGTLGVTRGNFDYKIGNLSTDYKTNGTVIGLGVERKVSERMSVTAEIERNAYKRKTVEFPNSNISTEATPAFTNVKLGLNFKF